MPEKYMGMPQLSAKQCEPNCTSCVDACPSDAISKYGSVIHLDIGKCIFCTNCSDICPTQAITFTKDYRMASDSREKLLLDNNPFDLATSLDKKTKKLFGRSLKLRQVSAGGCNACEADLNVLCTIGWDIGRFGIEFVASPRHADGIMVTGPVTNNMELALIKTYEAIPSPKLVIASGACSISGGIFASHSATNRGIDGIVPVNLYIPGCPPHPLTVIDGLLRLLDQI